MDNCRESKRTPQTKRTRHKFAKTFASRIEAEGYGPASVSKYRSTADAICDAMQASNLIPANLDDDCFNQLAVQIVEAASATDKKNCLFRINRFRDYLIDIGHAPQRPQPPLDTSPRAVLKREYEAYLRIQRGVSEDTIYHCLRFFDRFLTAKFGPGLGDLNAIAPADIEGFVARLREKQNAPRDKTVPSHLRKLFQFLFWSEKTDQNLSNIVPKVRQLKPKGIPRYLAPEEVNRLIESVRTHKKTGRRSHAMLMLVARLGLRAPEVIAIELDDIDWRAGEILIRGKGHRHDRMPMSQEVGEALVDYIKNERRGPERALFVSIKPPFRRFKDGQILRWTLRHAYDATGIKPPQAYIGSHVLRHSLATDMLRKGASLSQIGDVLRHRTASTTAIYAQHDIDTLRSISRPWPTLGDAQ